MAKIYDDNEYLMCIEWHNEYFNSRSHNFFRQVNFDSGLQADDGAMQRASANQEAGRKLPVPAWVQAGQAISPGIWECAVVLIDKPSGWTSFDVVAKLRGAIRIKKVGLRVKDSNLV